MGTFTVPIQVGDALGRQWETVEAYADTGAHFGSLPRPIWERLGLTAVDTATTLLADGSRRDEELAEARVRIGVRNVATLVVLGEEDTPVILGAYAMEGLRLAADPVNQRLVPMPIIPNLRQQP
jgi:predicted aspartyl protease